MSEPFYLSYFFYTDDLSKDLQKSFIDDFPNYDEDLVTLFSSENQKKITHFLLDRLANDGVINSGSSDFAPTLDLLQKIVNDDPAFLCRLGELLFLIGLKNDDPLFLLQAFDKFNEASLKNQCYFNDEEGQWWTLFGHLMLYLGEATSDLHYVHDSIEKYNKAILILEKKINHANDNIEEALSKDYLHNKNQLEKIYWYQGFSWVLLSKYSQEPLDLIQGINAYEKAIQLGCLDNSFWIHYGRALVLLGEQLNRIEYLQKGLEIFKKVISNSYPPLENDSVQEEMSYDLTTLRFKNHLHLADPFTEVWLQAVFTAKKIYESTHLRRDFLESHDLFEKASQAIADKNSTLWLHWGDLFLKASYFMEKIPFTEIALEKFTSPKLKDCDHLLATSLMTESLVLLGSLLENYKIIREADKRAQPLLQAAKDYAEAWVTNGLSQLSIGNYLSDESYLYKALEYFSKAIECESQNVSGWHGIFLTYMALAELKKEKSYFIKAQETICRVIEIRPLGAYFWYEFGLTLFKLYDYEDDLDLAINILEEALEKFEIALNLTGGLEITLEPNWLYPYACTLFLIGDLLGEEAYYNKSLEILYKLYEEDDEFPYIHFQFGVNYLRLGELSGDKESLLIAIDHLEKNIELDQEDSPGLGELGYAYLVISEWTDNELYPELSKEWKEKAERFLLTAARLGYEDAYYHLACLYSLMNRLDLSLFFIKRAEKSGLISAFEDLFYDEWLDNLRQSELFQSFLEKQNELDQPFFDLGLGEI